MTLKSKLLHGSGPEWESNTTERVCGDFEQFRGLMDCFYSENSRLSHRATLIILKVGERKPNWLQKQVPRMVDTLDEALPNWYKRNLLRILQFQRIPESHWGHAADQCFKYLECGETPVAVKVFSMTVIYRLTKDLPELANELRLIIEDQYPLGSPGFRARGRRILSQLSKDGL